MTVQVLVSTMHCPEEEALLEKMNIQTDAIVINQCDKNEVKNFTFRGRSVLWISCRERGVGLSRNTALMRSSADIVLFADDDVTYEDGYEQKLVDEFCAYDDAAMIVFNIKCNNPDRHESETQKTHRVHFYSSLRYGAYRFAARRDVLFHNRVFFSQLFGGGSLYSAGEDNIFLNDVLKAKKHVYASSVNIGQVTHAESTWFKGFNEKYFEDLGHLMYTIFKGSAYGLTAAMLVKNRKIYNKPIKDMLRLAYRGIRSEKSIK